MQLVTERLLLREFVADDWPAVLAYQSDPRYLRYYEWTGRTEQKVREFVQMFLDNQQEQPRRKFQLAVCLRGETRLFGNCGIRLSKENSQVADIGYELAPEHWGRGYATEAARAIVAFGFSELKVHRVETWCIAENTGSARVMEKIGMKREGRFRDKEWFKGRWWDTLLYSILEPEWKLLERKGDYVQCDSPT